MLEASWRTPPGEWAVTVYGTAGSAMFDYSTGIGTVTPASGEPYPLQFGEGDRFADEFRHVAHVWQLGGEPKAGVHDGVAANRILAQAYADNVR